MSCGPMKLNTLTCAWSVVRPSSAKLVAFNDLQRAYREIQRVAKQHGQRVNDWFPDRFQTPSPRQFMVGCYVVATALLQVAEYAPEQLVQLSERGRIVEGACLYVDRVHEGLRRAAVLPRGHVEEPEGDFQVQLAAQLQRHRRDSR